MPRAAENNGKNHFDLVISIEHLLVVPPESAADTTVPNVKLA
jgi:hypothetical protein